MIKRNQLGKEYYDFFFTNLQYNRERDDFVCTMMSGSLNTWPLMFIRDIKSALKTAWHLGDEHEMP
jgi:hypothetical protein